MLVAIDDLREHIRGNRVRLILRLRQLHERPRAIALQRRLGIRRVEHHVGEQHERGLELVLQRRESNRPRFIPHIRDDLRPEHLHRVGELVGCPRRRAFAQHLSRERADAELLDGLEAGSAANEIDVQRDQRQVVLFHDDELGAIRKRCLRPCRNMERRRFSSLGHSAAIELRLRGEREGDQERGDGDANARMQWAGDHCVFPMM